MIWLINPFPPPSLRRRHRHAPPPTYPPSHRVRRPHLLRSAASRGARAGGGELEAPWRSRARTTPSCGARAPRPWPRRARAGRTWPSPSESPRAAASLRSSAGSQSPASSRSPVSGPPLSLSLAPLRFAVLCSAPLRCEGWLAEHQVG